jgi:PAS domain S-box-containing protein
LDGIYKILFESVLEGLILVDSKGIIKLINPRTEEMFGFSSDELIGQRIEILIPARFHDRHHEHREGYVAKPAKRNMGSGMNLVARRKDQTDFPVEVSLNYIKGDNDETHVLALVSDITVRKRAQDEVIRINRELEELIETRTKALFESEQLYKSITKNFPAGIIYILSLDFVIQSVEGKDLQLHGKTPEECIGKNYIDTCDQDQATVMAMLKQVVEDDFARQIEIPKGAFFYATTATLLRDAQGEPTKILVVEHNITSQHNNTQQLEANLRDERQLSELKSRFVSMASHEFRTPLTTISSSASLISRYAEKGEAEKIFKHTSRIQSNVEHLTNILNDFLSLEKLESGKQNIKLQEVQLLEFMSDLKDEIKGILKPGQRIQLKGEDAQLISDPFVLKAALINLISNASKYSAEGMPVEVAWKIDQDSVHIGVTDHGIGIPDHEKELMFTRFFRAGNALNIEGTGLGLFIVKKYLELLKGNLTFESELNVGSTFTIEIPLTTTL